MTHPGVSEKIVDGVIYRTTPEEKNTIFGSASEGVLWDIYSSTWYNTDTGDQRIQIRHQLTMDIMATDVIRFEVSFRPNSKPTGINSSIIGEDYFTCKLTQD